MAMAAAAWEAAKGETIAPPLPRSGCDSPVSELGGHTEHRVPNEPRTGPVLRAHINSPGRCQLVLRCTFTAPFQRPANFDFDPHLAVAQGHCHSFFMTSALVYAHCLQFIYGQRAAISGMRFESGVGRPVVGRSRLEDVDRWCGSWLGHGAESARMLPCSRDRPVTRRFPFLTAWTGWNVQRHPTIPRVLTRLCHCRVIISRGGALGSSGTS